MSGPLLPPPPTRRTTSTRSGTRAGAVLAGQGLARRSVGPFTLCLFGVAASAPMTVLAGGIVTTYAVTGVIVVPLTFVILTGALGLFAIVYVPLVTRTGHAASFLAVLSAGLGRTIGTAGAAVAVVAYNGIQIGLYGLLGQTAADLAGGPWWSWALTAWALVAVLGILNIHLGARLLGVVLAAELAVICVIDLAGLTHPAPSTTATATAPGGPIGWLAGWDPSLLAAPGIGGALAFAVAAFIGFETGGAFAEETSPRAVRRAIFSTLGLLGGLYAVSAWALLVAVGPDRINQIAADPAAGLPFTILTGSGSSTGGADGGAELIAGLGIGLLACSIVGAMIAFHNVVARYLYAMGRENILTPRLAVTGGTGRGGVPTAGSITQSGLALLVIAIAALTRIDPTELFVWLSTLAAVGVIALMAATSLAATRTTGANHPHDTKPDAGGHGGRRVGGGGIAVRGPRSRNARRTAHQLARQTRSSRSSHPTRRNVATALVAAVVLVAVLAVTVSALGATVGGSPAQYSLYLLLLAAALSGAARARWLHRHRPGAWAAIGAGQPAPLAVPDRLGLHL